MPESVLITGASAGIGLACADRMHERGWTVFGSSRRAQDPATRTRGAGWTPVGMDVDLDESVTTGFDEVLGATDRLDAVVACAGWGLAGAVEDTPIEEARRQMETNFWGAVRVVQHALPVMRRQHGGRIVLVSSIGGVLGIPFQSFYSASKFALEGFGEALAYEVAGFGIQVTLVEPGNVATEFTANRRVAEAGPTGSAYTEAADKAVSIMARDEANGVEPAKVAAVVQRALESKRVPRRMSVGSLDERVGIIGKRLLPFRLFEKAAKGSLGV